MPNGNVTTLAVPPERRDQLRALANAHGENIAETIERLINRAIEEGELPDTLPGYDVAVTEDGGVRIEFKRRFTFPRLQPVDVHVMAIMFEQIADDASKSQQHATFAELVVPAALTLRRVGTGIGIACGMRNPDQTFAGTMTKGMARDFARILRNAARQALKKVQ